MFIVVQHQISDPQQFWEIAKRETGNLPEGVELISVYPDATGGCAVCLWRAGSLDQVKDFIEGHCAKISTNHYFEVAEDDATGLPG